MIVYRLTLPAYASDLNGTGAALYGGRWNSMGNFMLYTSQTSSLSILEHLAHMIGAEPVQYVLTTLEVKNDIEEFPITSLPSSWQEAETLSQEIGDEWIKRQRSAVLCVPSVINPLEKNILINPRHPQLNLMIRNQDWHIYDARLLRK